MHTWPRFFQQQDRVGRTLLGIRSMASRAYNVCLLYDILISLSGLILSLCGRRAWASGSGGHFRRWVSARVCIPVRGGLHVLYPRARRGTDMENLRSNQKKHGVPRPQGGGMDLPRAST